MRDVCAEPWANASTVGAMALAVNSLVDFGHLQAYQRRARQPLRLRVLREVYRQQDARQQGGQVRP
jgi:hypothetical protein